MRIGLIDVDHHNYPNLVQMKLSAWHKANGDTVEWWSEDAPVYDIVYMSKVFSATYTMDMKTPKNAEKCVRGGTGYAILCENGKEVYHPESDPPLPFEVEHVYPDYSLYPEYTGYGQSLAKQTAYGFLTRGCPRGCAFCHVGPKEGKASIKVADLSEFWRGQGRIRLSDPNILACKDRKELLQQLIEANVKVDFNQGLDARLLDCDMAKLLVKIKAQPRFAMDTVAQMDAVKRGLLRYQEAYVETGKKWKWQNSMVFILTNFDTTHEQDMERVMWVKEHGFRPYISVYNKYFNTPINKRLASWCDNAITFAKYDTFEEYQMATWGNILKAQEETHESNTAES